MSHRHFADFIEDALVEVIVAYQLVAAVAVSRGSKDSSFSFAREMSKIVFVAFREIARAVETELECNLLNCFVGSLQQFVSSD